MKEKTRALPLYWFKDIFPSDTHLVRSLPQATDRDCYNLSSIFLLYRVTKLLFPRADPNLRSIYKERKGPEKPRCTFNFSASVGDRFIATHDYGVSDLGRRTSFFLSFFLARKRKRRMEGIHMLALLQRQRRLVALLLCASFLSTGSRSRRG
jgi:hypothetical protein